MDSLRLDVIAQVTICEPPHPPDLLDYLLTTALEPLKSIKARIFEVELNIEPSQKVWNTLGHVNFVTVLRERAYNVRLWGTIPRTQMDLV